MLEVTRDTDVYTASDEHVGSVDRIVLDPVTRRMSHVVVRKGLFFPEDKLIAVEDVSSATPERINLRQGLVADELQPFVEQHYVPLDDADQPAGVIDAAGGFVAAWYGPPGIAAPVREAAMLTVHQRNIPEHLMTLDAGVPVFATDHQVLGRLERIITTNDGLPTHLVVEADGLSADRRAIPIGWVKDITEDAIVLAATTRMVAAIVPLGADE